MIQCTLIVESFIFFSFVNILYSCKNIVLYLIETIKNIFCETNILLLFFKVILIVYESVDPMPLKFFEILENF